MLHAGKTTLIFIIIQASSFKIKISFPFDFVIGIPLFAALPDKAPAGVECCGVPGLAAGEK